MNKLLKYKYDVTYFFIFFYLGLKKICRGKAHKYNGPIQLAGQITAPEVPLRRRGIGSVSPQIDVYAIENSKFFIIFNYYILFEARSKIL